MKKTLKVLCLCFVAVIVVAALVSCQNNEEKAESLLEKADKKADKADSYKQTLFFDTMIPSAAGDLKIESSGTLLVASQNKEDYKMVSDASVKITASSSAEPLQEQTVLSGYIDGKAFGEFGGKKFCSEMTAADYIAYEKDQNEGFDLDFSLLDGQDGYKLVLDKETNTVSTEGALPAEFVDQLLRACDFESIFTSADITVSDPYLSFTITFTEDRFFKDWTIRFGYDTVVLPEELREEYKDYKPTGTFTSTFSDWNSTEPTAPDFEDYLQIDDIRGVDRIVDSINEITNAKSGKYNIKSTYNLRSAQNGTLVEQNEVEFEKAENGLSYTLAQKLKGNGVYGSQNSDYLLTYKDGKLTVLNHANNNSSSEDRTEEEAWSVLEGQYGIFKFFDITKTTGVTKAVETDGTVTYRFTLEGIRSTVMSSLGIIAPAKKCTFSVVFRDDAPVKYTLYLYSESTQNGVIIKLEETTVFALA